MLVVAAHQVQALLCVSTHDPNFRTSLMQDGIKILADDASCSLLEIFDVDAARGID